MPNSSTPASLASASAGPLSTFISRPEGLVHHVTQDGRTLLVRSLATGQQVRWTLNDRPAGTTLECAGPVVGGDVDEEALAAIEAAFAARPDCERLWVQAPVSPVSCLWRSGGLLREGGQTVVARELFFQQSRLWLPQCVEPFALQYVMTDGKRHPRRAPKPSGVVYERHIPWLNQTLSYRAVSIDDDLPRFNRWMNDPAVAQFWQEEGDLAQHRSYLETIANDPHMVSMIASFDGEPFGYFEVYWAKENRIAPFYDVQDFDRGWHVLIGEPAYRGKQCATAWLTSISHYLFLDDPRTQRVVGEPRADHERQIRNLDKSGYAKVKEFNFPHKRAMLVMMLRERYFGDQLWLPRAEPAAAAAPTTKG